MKTVTKVFLFIINIMVENIQYHDAEYLAYYNEDWDQEKAKEIKGSLIYETFALIKISHEEAISLREKGVHLQEVLDKNQLHLGPNKIACASCEMLKLVSTTDDITDDLPVTWLLQFRGPLKESWLKKLHQANVQTYGYLQPYTIFAYASTKIMRSIVDLHDDINDEKVIAWIGRYDYKTKSQVHTGIRLESIGESIIHRFPWSQELQVKGDIHPFYQEDVLHIESYHEPHLHNAEAKAVTRTQSAYSNGLFGNGEIIAITDTGIYKPHEVFAASDKILTVIDVAGDSNQLGGDGDGHGTHVSGSVGGDALPYNESNKEDGQAIMSRLVDVKVFNNQGAWRGGSDEYIFWQEGYQVGARTNNNSWGADTYGNYTSTDRNADRVMNDYKNYILIIANGNAGPNPRTVGSPAVAKNVISVGSVVSSSPQDVSYFSSRGPTIDGRIKPDIMAPGDSIISARTQTRDQYIAYRGTSMASPQITGIAALARQYIREGKYGGISFEPSAALIKALLINGAQEIIGSTGDTQREYKVPNNSQGWGLVNVERSLPAINNPNARQITLWDQPNVPTTGTTWRVTFNLNHDTSELKFTLVWTDLPAIPGATIALVNNLNLKVTAPDGRVFFGNNFTGLNPSYSVAGGVFDNLNNVEGVHLIPNKSFPGAVPLGNYTLDVIGQNVPSLTSNFAMVAGFVKSTTSTPVPIPTPIIDKVAVIGDYQNQLKNLLTQAGFNVDSYGYNDTTIIANAKNYVTIIINKIANTPSFISLVRQTNPTVGLIFLGAYPIQQYGLGVLSLQTRNPLLVNQQDNLGPVKIGIITSHPIFNGLGLGTTVTVVNGGDNDYQTFTSVIGGQTIGTSAMPIGFAGMIAVENSTSATSRKVLLASFGLSQFTNTTHWTNIGIKIFINSVKWAAKLPMTS